ncbi:MAG: recombinase family protein [Elusimicrobiota bacterium]
MDKITEKLKVAIYIRVSTVDQQREGFSLENQFESCQNYVLSKNNLELVTKNIKDVYQDVESGFSIERKGYQALLRDARLRKFDGIVVWRLDRFTRNTRAGLTDLAELTDLGIKVFSVVEGEIDSTTSTGKMISTFLIAMAEAERNRIKERVMPGMISGVKKGHWQGARYSPYGTRYNKEKGCLEWVEKEVKVIKIVFSEFISGSSIWTIAKHLYHLNYQNRVAKEFTTHMIELIIRREMYCDGIIRWGKGEKRVESEKPVIEPIIDRATWEKANEILDVRRKKYFKGNWRSDSPHEFQGVVKCRYCHKNMHGTSYISNHKTGEKKEAYRCGTYMSRTKVACKGQGVYDYEIRKHVLSIMREIVRDKNLIEIERQEYQDSIASRNPDLINDVKIIEKKLRDNKSAQRKCFSMIYKGMITDVQFKEENSRLVKEEEELNKRLKEAKEQLYTAQVYGQSMNKIFTVLSDFNRVYDGMAVKDRNLLWRTIFEYVCFTDPGRRQPKTVESFGLYQPFNRILEHQKSENVLEILWKRDTFISAHSDVR